MIKVALLALAFLLVLVIIIKFIFVSVYKYMRGSTEKNDFETDQYEKTIRKQYKKRR